MWSNRIGQGKHYLTHWLNSVDEHSLQAPFIYDFYTRVVKGDTINPCFQDIQNLRRSLEKDHNLIKVTDLGTGSSKPLQRRISSLAKTSHQPKVSRLLFNIASYFRPQVIVELGTNLGLSTLHLAAGAPEAEIITLEGCHEISQIAMHNFKKLEAERIKVVTGNIDTTLEPVLSTLKKIDLLFMDANHQFKPTMDYFNKCLSRLTSDSIVVVDDIHWSPSMHCAWEQLKCHDRVTLTVDLFFVGVIFFQKNRIKTHYVVSL